MHRCVSFVTRDWLAACGLTFSGKYGIHIQNENNHNKIKIRVITKLPNSEHSYKGKVKTHKYTNRQNQSTTGKL